jgi:hypothetical protein
VRLGIKQISVNYLDPGNVVDPRPAAQSGNSFSMVFMNLSSLRSAN